MERIGLVAAIFNEAKYLTETLGKVQKTHKIGKWEVLEFHSDGKKFFFITSEIGEIAAALATQLLILHFDVQCVLNMGLVGSLKSQFKRQDVVFVDEVVHYDFTLNYLEKDKQGKYPHSREDFALGVKNILTSKAKQLFPCRFVRIATGDKFINCSELKADLVSRFDADICDMESAGIYFACKNFDIPFLMIKCVSDNADESAEETFDQVVAQGVQQYVQIVKTLATSV